MNSIHQIADEIKMQRNILIDGLRGLAIILVLGLHFFDLVLFANGGSGHDRNYVYRVFGHGYFGVTIFFVLSGFLIASTSVDIKNCKISLDIPRFYVRRITRIVPPLLLAVVIGLMFLKFGSGGSPSKTFQYLFHIPGTVFSAGFWFAIAAFSFNWFRVFAGGETHGWFGLQWDVLWSLSVEEQFYIAFPWIIIACKTTRILRGSMYAVIASCVLARLILILTGSDLAINFANSVVCFDALAIGVVVASYPQWSIMHSRWSALAGSVLMAFAYLCGSKVLVGLPTFMIAVATGMLLQGLRGSQACTSNYALRVIPAFGRLSYGLYLFHPIAFFIVTPIAVLSLNPAIGFLIAIGSAFALATISFTFLERPIERWTRAWLFNSMRPREDNSENLSIRGAEKPKA